MSHSHDGIGKRCEKPPDLSNRKDTEQELDIQPGKKRGDAKNFFKNNEISENILVIFFFIFYEIYSR